MKNQTLILLLILSFSLSGFCFPQEKKKESDRYYIVTKVVDGDTFWIDDGSGKGLKIRLTGVDAPETKRTRNKEIGYYAQESKKYLEELIMNNKVRLEYDVDTMDQYRRILAYVYLEDGTFVNAHMIENGYATIMTVPPNVKYAEMFLKLSQKARKQGKGLYGR
jgi:micrococcal nuclease